MSENRAKATVSKFMDSKIQDISGPNVIVLPPDRLSSISGKARDYADATLSEDSPRRRRVREACSPRGSTKVSRN
ncbi:hypothetical protein PoB_006702500 [Plakobranchus ocellatus]|uniref:Uncharacterized protein n=1 Tax=Plakobranchus ocellatus TaxID=259542 RepID=A0AAV4D8X6_9GAST|nr:hypothetical protein PoB_006702500 [Plakobranchus ocellatus]